MNTNKNKKLQNAIDFLNFNIKFGVYEQEMFEGMTDYELIKFAEYEAARADLAVDDYKETYFSENLCVRR